MTRLSKSFVLSVGCLLVFAAAARAETKVTLKSVHLCCPMCVTAVGETLKDLTGVKGECSQQDKTIVLTATDAAAAQKAVDALAKAGFHGKPDSDVVKYKPVETPKGNVQKLELTGIHNCCGMCARIIKQTVTKVKGVTSDTSAAKKDEFTVEGDFSASDLVQALLDAGFHVQVKKS
jgi:mercuric ion binding protein